MNSGIPARMIHRLRPKKEQCVRQSQKSWFCPYPAVVIGEGELGWPQLIAEVDLGRYKPIYKVADREFDLAEAPMPAFEPLDECTRQRRREF